MNHFRAARELHRLGHAPQFAHAVDAMVGFTDPGVLADAVKNYQRFHALPETGQLDERTLGHLERPRCCSHPDVMPLTAAAKWATSSLTYFESVNLPGIPADRVRALYAQSWGQWQAVAGISATAAADGSLAINVSAVAGPIDGPDNILALSELPPPNAPPSLTLHQTFDWAETWTEAMLLAVFTHENGHALGLGHSSDPGDLMAPCYNPAVSSPQPGDVAAIQGLYGPSLAASSPASVETAQPRPSALPAATGLAVTFNLAVPEAGTYSITIRRVG